MKILQSRQIAIALHVLIWSAILIVPYLVTSSDPSVPKIGYIPCHYFTLTNILHIALFYLNAFVFFPRLFTMKRWWLYLLSITSLVILVYQFKVWILTNFYPDIYARSNAFAFTFSPIVFFLVLSTMYKLVVDRMRGEKEQLAIELKFLRSQVSPHFLFNVLNNFVSMARYKSDLLEPSLIKLSGLMRYMLYDSAQDRVSLQSELDYLKGYIELQELRFEEHVVIHKELAYDDGSHMIEPMLLIPFVENAFKHGITDENKTSITVQADVANNQLTFAVINSIASHEVSRDDNAGIGIGNVRARLNLLYPNQHQLTIRRQDRIFSVNLTLTFR